MAWKHKVNSDLVTHVLCLNENIGNCAIEGFTVMNIYFRVNEEDVTKNGIRGIRL